MNISVIIPVYNAAHFIEAAVKSALAHSEVKEIILIEDGSPDNSNHICELLTEKYSIVKLFHHPNRTNKGAGASRNLGIRKATQEYICFLDADDIMTEIRFHKEKTLFETNDSIDGVYGALGTKYYDQTGAKAWEKRGLTESSLTTVNKEIAPSDLFAFLIGIRNNKGYNGYFSLVTLTVKRKKLLLHNLLFDESLRLHQDSVFIFQCAYYLNLCAGEIGLPIAIRGVHENNRYILHRNINESRAKQFKSLLNWANKHDLEKEYKQFFEAYYYFHKTKALNNYFAQIIALPCYLSNPRFRKLYRLKQS
jgi:glycosyltransferase involved in cell wall biosynthesis